jgi:hypothetical protein
MKALFTLLLLGSATACFAQSDYTYVAETTTKLGDESVPAYRTLADTTGKPSSKLFAHSTVDVIGRLGNRWTIVRKGDTEYAIRTSQLPTDAQQVAMGALAAKAIPFDPATNKILYTEVVQVPGTSQTELYTRAKLWFASTFKSAKAVVQADEKEVGVIQGSAFQSISVMALGMPSRVRLWYTVKMTLKDGRYKYEITDFQVQDNPSQYNLNPELVLAEGYIDTYQKKGIRLSIARSARRELAFAGTQLSAAIISGMSKPAVGTTDAGKDW